jgi:hypothetical protein
VLALGLTVRCDFTLRIAGQAETVTVIAKSAAATVYGTEISTVISGRQIGNLQLFINKETDE